MKIAVLCPSWNNPMALLEAQFSFHATHVLDETAFLPVVEEGDPRIREYHQYVGSLLEVPHDRVGSALNYAAMRAIDDYDVVGFIADNHRFRTHAWDRVMAGFFSDHTAFLYPDDLTGTDLPSSIFVSSSIVRALGWMGLPKAKHLFLDDTWKQLGTKAGCLYYDDEIVIERLSPVFIPVAYEHDRIAYQVWLATQAEADIAKVRTLVGGTP